MILVYAGRRIDPDDPASAERFPLSSVAHVAHQVERVLHRLRPTTVVGSAACGADLLVLEAAGRLRMRRRVILPFGRTVFRASSVTDRPGDWGPRFDAVIDEVDARGDLIELALVPENGAAYRQANEEIFRQADSMAHGSHEACRALVVWNGAPRGSGDVTAAFLDEARRLGWPTTEIDTVESTAKTERM